MADISEMQKNNIENHIGLQRITDFYFKERTEKINLLSLFYWVIGFIVPFHIQALSYRDDAKVTIYGCILTCLVTNTLFTLQEFIQIRDMGIRVYIKDSVNKMDIVFHLLFNFYSVIRLSYFSQIIVP